MKRFSIFCALLVIITTQLACSLLSTQPKAVTPMPTSTASMPETPAVGNSTEVIPATDTPAASTPLPVETPTAVETPSSNISLDKLKNFSYWIEDFNTQAALVDGVFSDANIQVQMIDQVAFGDLNGDGQADAAVILTIHSGGSGTFFDLIAVLDQDGTPVQADSSYIGDRQGINNLEIAGGRIVLDYLTQGPMAPLCCPNEHRLRSYLLENNVLRLASEQILDSPTAQATPLPDAILIDQPVTGDHITIPLQVRGRVSQTPPEKKLVYYLTDINGTLLLQGDVDVTGEPGGPGAFAFEFSMEPVTVGVFQLEVVDSANGILRGRSTVVLPAQ